MDGTHSLNKYPLCIHIVPATVLGSGNTVMNQANMFLPS